MQTTNLGASPPLILGFRPSKRHAVLITCYDQGSVVLAFTLVLLVLKRFWRRVMLVILMFVAWLLEDLLCFIAYHLRISCCLRAIMFQSYASSCRIELVAQRQHPASFMSSRSNLLWFALILRVGIISAGWAMQTDWMIRWRSRCFILTLIGIVPGIGSC